MIIPADNYSLYQRATSAPINQREADELIRLQRLVLYGRHDKTI